MYLPLSNLPIHRACALKAGLLMHHSFIFRINCFRVSDLNVKHSKPALWGVPVSHFFVIFVASLPHHASSPDWVFSMAPPASPRNFAGHITVRYILFGNTATVARVVLYAGDNPIVVPVRMPWIWVASTRMMLVYGLPGADIRNPIRALMGFPNKMGVCQCGRETAQADSAGHVESTFEWCIVCITELCSRETYCFLVTA